MAAKMLAIVVVLYLLSGFAGGSAPSQRFLPDSESELGKDMCPECGPLPPWTPEVPHDDVHDKDFSRDTSTHRLSTPAAKASPSSTPEEDLGADMCPECGALPPRMSKVSRGDVYENGVDDISSECRQSLATPVSKAAPCGTVEEDLGADICPECAAWMPKVPSSGVHENDQREDIYSKRQASPILALKASICSTADDDLGVDMCPEKGQPLSVGGNSRLQSAVTAEPSSLLRQLQNLLSIQQLQIDHLAEILYQLRKPAPEAGPGATKLRTSSESSDAIDPALANQRPSKDGMFPGEGGFGTRLAKAAGLGCGTGVVTIARYKPAWAGHFSFLSAVKLSKEVSCLHVLPQVESDGLSRYVAVGDQSGRLYIFSWLGDLLLDYPTNSRAPITTMVSWAGQQNATILATGHADGAVLVHQLWEKTEGRDSSTDGGATFSSVEPLYPLVPPSPSSIRSGPKDPSPEWDTWNSDREGNASIRNLEMYKVGKMRYVIVGGMGGKIQIFRDNGSLFGVAHSPSRPLAFMRIPNAQKMVFLTERGVGSLDLRNMRVHSNLCEGLNGSTVTAYAFDVTGRSKAYGFTDGGHVLSVALTGNMVRMECHVRKRRDIESSGPFTLQALKGYLLAATSDAVLVFNATMPAGRYADFWKAGPTPLFSVALDEIARSFLPAPLESKRGQGPLMTSNREKLVVLGFGGGYVGMFRSNMATAKPAHFGAKFWNSSVVIVVLALVVLWQFAKKKDPGPVMGPEYPGMSSPSSGVSPYGKEESERTEFGIGEKGAEPRRLRIPRQGLGSVSFDGRGFRPLRSAPVKEDKYPATRKPQFSSTQPTVQSELRH